MPPKTKGKQGAVGIPMVVLGSGGVGKSCLTIKFLKNEFMVDYDPTIEETYRKTVLVDGAESVLDIVDTAGQQEYHFLRGSHLRQGKAFLLCYSIVDPASFNEVKELYNAITNLNDGPGRVACIVVGCKKDLENNREVAAVDARQYAESIKCPWIETSAKDGTNVVEAFNIAVREVRNADKAAAKKSSKGGCQLL